MTEIVATPTSLRIGEYEIALEGHFGLTGRLYDEHERLRFFFDCLRELARERGISSDRDAIYDHGTNYYFLTNDERHELTYPRDPPPDTAPSISFCDAEARNPKYVKFLRIEPRERDEVVASPNVEQLEEKIKSLHLEGLKVIIPEKMVNRSRAYAILSDEIYCELALVADYNVKIEY